MHLFGALSAAMLALSLAFLASFAASVLQTARPYGMAMAISVALPSLTAAMQFVAAALVVRGIRAPPSLCAKGLSQGLCHHPMPKVPLEFASVALLCRTAAMQFCCSGAGSEVWARPLCREVSGIDCLGRIGMERGVGTCHQF